MQEGAVRAFALPPIALCIATSVPDAAWGPSLSLCVFAVLAWGPWMRTETGAPRGSGVAFAECRPDFHARAQEEPGKQDPPQELAPPVCAKEGSEDEALLVERGAVLPGVLVTCENCAGLDRAERDVRTVQEFRLR